MTEMAFGSWCIIALLVSIAVTSLNILLMLIDIRDELRVANKREGVGV